MFKSALDVKTRLKQLMQAYDFSKYVISENNWDELHQLCEFLEPFNAATDMICGDNYPTLCIFLPVYSILSNKLVQNQYDDAINPVALKMIDNLQKCHRYAANMDVNYWSTILDPRFKIKWFQSEVN
ncbi:hypothetical protein PsorP6_016994 [Peronosclerospora sorghi]|uniref:Uncharacterized protein n=1 Tax=Peronosclerospora sorghi TaxID=230839 RepID=A0ACC0WCU5_9STRA|nr:hypothetical protein PsorP6_016994 [Peronosclerospora sorghi]